MDPYDDIVYSSFIDDPYPFCEKNPYESLNLCGIKSALPLTISDPRIYLDRVPARVKKIEWVHAPPGPGGFELYFNNDLIETVHKSGDDHTVTFDLANNISENYRKYDGQTLDSINEVYIAWDKCLTVDDYVNICFTFANNKYATRFVYPRRKLQFDFVGLGKTLIVDPSWWLQDPVLVFGKQRFPLTMDPKRKNEYDLVRIGGSKLKEKSMGFQGDVMDQYFPHVKLPKMFNFYELKPHLEVGFKSKIVVDPNSTFLCKVYLPIVVRKHSDTVRAQFAEYQRRTRPRPFL